MNAEAAYTVTGAYPYDDGEVFACRDAARDKADEIAAKTRRPAFVWRDKACVYHVRGLP